MISLIPFTSSLTSNCQQPGECWWGKQHRDETFFLLKALLQGYFMFVQQKLDRDVHPSLKNLMDSSWCLSGLSHTGPEHLFLGVNVKLHRCLQRHHSWQSLPARVGQESPLLSVQRAALLQRGCDGSRVCDVPGKQHPKGMSGGAARHRQHQKSCRHPARCSGFAWAGSPASSDASFNVRTSVLYSKPL